MDFRLEIFLGWIFLCYLRIGLRFTTQMCTEQMRVRVFCSFFCGFVAMRMLKMFARKFKKFASH